MALMTYKKLNQTKLSLSLFHLNTCSLKKKFDELEYLIKTTNQTFDVINISEYRIKVILILQLTLTCPTISLNTHQQNVMLEELSNILVKT